MKARRVLVQLEIETDATIKDLGKIENWEFADNFSWKEFVIKQTQVNVVQKNK